MESGEEAGVSVVPGGRPDAAAQATTKAARLAASPRAIPADGSQPGVEFGFRSRPVGRGAAVSSFDDSGRVHTGKPGHRSRTEAEGRRCGWCFESDPWKAWSSEGVVLRQRVGVHQSDHGPVGVSQPGADRLLPARKTDRQRACGVVQRHVASRVLGCALFATLTEAKQVIEYWRRE